MSVVVCRVRGLVACAALLLACRKPPPAEIVYTGSAPVLPVLPGPELEPGAAGVAPAPGAADPGAAGPGTALAPSPGASVLPAPGASAPSLSCAPPAAPGGPFSKAQLIAATADCAVWHYCQFEAEARALETSAVAYRDAPGPASQSAAQQAFLSAMASWQRAELFRFGPAARSGEPGGQDLRDLIYAWPVRPECKVDEQTLSQSYALPGFRSLDFSASPLTGRTLIALEYLLFNSSTMNRCSPYSVINAGGGWATLTPEQIATRRRAYAAEAAADVRGRAEQLVSAWSPGGGNFPERFLQSGAGNPLFSSEQQVLNAVSNALFYLDLELKDWKLATPLGLTPECSAAVCPDAVESRYTPHSVAYLKENVLGFRRLFQGCGADYAGVGFDDWLRDAGAPDLAERMLAGLGAIEAALDRVPGPLAQALVSSRELPLAVHTAVKAVTDPLKTEFVTVLNLELPAASEGDND